MVQGGQSVKRALVAAGFLLLPGLFLGQSFAAQEKGDVQFRTLGFPLQPDDHSAVYWEYTTNDPTNLINHLVIEMLGPSSLLPGFGPNRIVANTLRTFVDASPTYYGAFTLPNQILTRDERDGIVRAARRLRDQTVPVTIVYVDSPVFYYLDFEDLNGDLKLQENEIRQMRSDAFVEYCYAASVAPIVVIQGQTILTDPGLFRFEAAAERLYPSSQLSQLRAAPIDHPAIELRVAAGLTIHVKDDSSGPGRLEIVKAAIGSGGTLIGANDEDFPSTEHAYTSNDQGLSVLANLPEGAFFVRAIDQAGNYTVTQYSVTGVPPLVSWDLRRAPLPPRIKQFQGLDLSDQTTVADDAFVNVTALGGLADLRIQKDGETIHHFAAFSATSAPALYGPISIRDTFTPPPAKLPDGVYTFTAVDANNRTTIGSLRHFTFDLSVARELSRATYDETGNKFISRVALEARSNSGYGVKEIEVYPVRRDLASDEVVYLG